MKDKNKKKKKKITKKQIGTTALSLALTLILLISLLPKMKNDEDNKIPYNEFIANVEKGQVESINYDPYYKEMEFKLKEDETVYITDNPKSDNFKREMLEANVAVDEKNLENSFASSVGSILLLFLQYGMLMGMMVFVMKRIQGGTDEMTITTSSTNKFEDVAGLEEVKESLLTTVDMLKNPKKYAKAGARISKGVLLYGPPGTGKTLIAKAIAGEAGVNFMAVNGSDFENKFVGVGADKVRKIFAEAKKNAPCILFIDELDAIGCKRSDYDTSYSRQTLNQLLGCMDGFDASDGVFVFAATNAPDSLDQALLRPGRFDSRFAVGLPDTAKDRMSVIKLYLKNKKIDETVSIETLAKQTIGCSPATIEAIINEAAIESVKNNGVITQSHIDEAFYRQLMGGHKKKDSDRNENEIKTVAYHEAGHAIVGYLQNEEVSKISIVPTTSGAGGVTIFNQKKMGMYSKTELESHIRTLYAGRNAEVILNGEADITTGASNDIKEATKAIKGMVSAYGMSKYGLLNLEELDMPMSDLMEEYMAISKKLETESMKLLTDNKDLLDRLSKELMEKETLDENDLIELFEKEGKENKENTNVETEV